MSKSERKKIAFSSYDFDPMEYDVSGVKTISEYLTMLEKDLTDSIPAKAEGYTIEPAYGMGTLFSLSFWRYETDEEFEKRLESNKRALERKKERDIKAKEKKEKAERALLERLKKKYE